jgi:hypothetical protein
MLPQKPHFRAAVQTRSITRSPQLGGYVRRLDQRSITLRDEKEAFRQFFRERTADKSQRPE